MVDFVTLLKGEYSIIEKHAQFFDQIARNKITETNKYVIINSLIIVLGRLLYTDIKEPEDAKKYAHILYKELTKRLKTTETDNPSSDLFVPTDFH